MKILEPLRFHDYRALTSRWLSVPRPAGGWPPRIIVIHATRGGSGSYRLEYDGTIVWSRSPNNNQGGWGSSEQRVLQGRDVAIIVDTQRQCTYGAGYAGPGSLYAVDSYGLDLEIAQMRIDTPFEETTLDTAARQCAAWCILYHIPVVRIPYLDQSKPLQVAGFVGHEDTGNGRILGKSDPGPAFPWPSFLNKVSGYIQQETAPVPLPPPTPTPPPPPPEPEEEDDMPRTLGRIQIEGRPEQYLLMLTDDGREKLVHLASPANVAGLQPPLPGVTKVQPDDHILDVETTYHGIPQDLRG